ncbi:uncharacterized protein [Montipora foliosa]|uniref:uncharacterized protein isoform X1 n=2 Tax=Montipora foliosa TaxID=591990 RepID=UPI0035F17671
MASLYSRSDLVNLPNEGFIITEGEDGGHSTEPILPAETATYQTSSLNHTRANAAADSIYFGDGGAWQATEQSQLMGAGANQANGLSDAAVGGAVRNQPSESIEGPNNGLWQSRTAESGGGISDWHLANITVDQTSGRDYSVMGRGAHHVIHNGHAASENVYSVVYSGEGAQQINGLSGGHEEEPVAEEANGSGDHRVGRARRASGRSYVDNASGISYRRNGTVAGDDLPYPIREDVTCLPVQEKASSLIVMPCFRSVSHVTTHCPVSNAERTALCYQQLRSFDWPPNLISSTGRLAMEHTCTDEEIRNWKQKLTRTNPQTAAMKRSISGGTFFIMEIGEVSQHFRFETPILSDAVYSYRFERLMGIRIYPNGVGSGRGTHVALFIHMMESAFDDLLDWPYAGTVTVSVQDRSGSTARSDISRIIQANPYLSTFQKPDETICRTGYGYERFARIEEFFGPRYVKDDKLLLKIEFSG